MIICFDANMGNEICELNCCHNNFIIHKDEKDIVTNVRKQKLLISKDINNDLNSKKNNSSHNDVGQNNHLQTIEKHIKDTSFKLNKSKILEDLTLRKKQLQSLTDKTPILNLEVMNQNPFLKKGVILSIDCFGLASEINRRGDGYVFFGFYPHNMSLPTDENEIIDFNLQMNYNNELNKNANYESENANNIGRHFMIEFSIEKMGYIIRDLGGGYGAFVKLDNIHNLKDNQLINIGQIFIVIYICDKAYDGNNNDISHFSVNQNKENNSIASVKVNQLKLKVYSMNFNGDTFYFMPQNRNITIGRSELASVKLNDKLLSQIHCVINYTENEGWKIMDGQPGKPSTNGTWLYINEECNVYDKMIFKTNQIMFQANIIESK